MFGAFKKIGQNIASLNKEEMFREIFSEPVLQKQIIDANQKQLYEQGVDSEGEPTGEYSDATIYGTSNFEGKIEKGEPYDHVTLKDSGDSYDSMKVDVGDKFIHITGNFPESIKRGWPDALGLTEESKADIRPEVKDRMIDYIRKQLHKK